jgi:FKBP-type peptidyl-prolyl cis-trans isomerase
MPDKDKLSYAIGMSIANNIKRDQLELDVDTVAIAMKDVLGGKTTRITEAELKDTMTQFQRAMPGWVAARNKTKGDEFLAKNKASPGITALPNGLQYKVLKEGSGPTPKTNDTVIVAYKGMLVDGTVFDQNEHFNTPVTGRTIKGWSEILPMMKTGSKWEVTIPSDLAYGPRGTRGIGPDSVLIFDMELLSIEPPGSKPAPTPVSNRPPSPASLHSPPGPPSAGTPPGSTTPVVSGQIIKVPSADELKKGAKIEVITNPPPNQ